MVKWLVVHGACRVVAASAPVFASANVRVAVAARLLDAKRDCDERVIARQYGNVLLALDVHFEGQTVSLGHHSGAWNGPVIRPNLNSARISSNMNPQ